mgnify:CR=1 FL=1
MSIRHFSLPDFLQRIYSILIQPKSQYEDIRRKEIILNLIILGTLLLVLWSNIVIILAHIHNRNQENIISLLPFTLLTFSFLSLYILSRKGKITLASYGLIILYLAGSLYGTFRWGVTLPAIILSYALLITITSILISSRAGLITTFIIVIGIIVFGYEEVVLKTIPTWRSESISFFDIAEYSIILLVISLVSWLSSKEIEKSLHRARRSERELKAERDSLAVTIEEKTQELELAQKEKVSQLYRFAEFGRLSSGLFHDVVNPLTAISLNLQTINNSIHPDLPVVKEDIDRAITASQRMESLISTVSRQVRPEVSLTSFSIKEVIQEILVLFSHRARLLNIQVVCEIPEDITLFGNPHKFQQVITNLCSNAFDSYDEASNGEFKIIVRAWKQDTSVYVSITDYGPGIAPEILPNIFNPFFSTKETSKGMGLGLSMVKSIVTQDFNGEIKAESSSENGTIFTLSFPLTT